MLVAVGNGPAYGGGMKVTPDASFDDGLLDVLADGRDALVKIPPGVAHGYRPLTVPCGLFYLVTRCFDLGDPDEYRVAWDHPAVRGLWDVANE